MDIRKYTTITPLIISAGLVLSACQSSDRVAQSSVPMSGISASVENGLIEPKQTRKRDYVDFSKAVRDKTQILRSDGKHFAMLSDANADGKLDFAEFAHHKHAIYMKWDENSDGLFTKGDLGYHSRNETDLAKIEKNTKKFNKHDKDKNGTLDITEFAEVWRANYKNIDKDQDGFLSAKEMMIKQDLK